MPTKRTRYGLMKTTGSGRAMRRTFRKRVSRKRIMRSKRGRVLPNYSFHRWITAMPDGFVGVTGCTYDLTTSVITCSPTNTSSEFSLSFPFKSIPNYSEFTTLFDSYMITGVLLQFKLVNNPDSNRATNDTVSAQGANIYPTIWYSADHDDSLTTSLSALKEYERVRHRVLYPNRELNIMLRPTILLQTYRSTLTTGYQQTRRSTWLDMAQVDIPHYGFKCAIDFEGVSPIVSNMIKLNAKFYFKCKQVR